MRCGWSVWGVLCLWTFISAEKRVLVSKGITTIFRNESIQRQVECEMEANTSFFIILTLWNGSNALTLESHIKVEPEKLEFPASLTSQRVMQSFRIFGYQQGRYRLSYTLTQNTAKYSLSASDSVILVTNREETWDGIAYQFSLNVACFILGSLFLIACHFSPFAGYRAVIRARWIHRLIKFWQLECDGSFVCKECGIPAALLNRFHLDAGRLCIALSVCSLVVMVPVNYFSGSAQEAFSHVIFQQTTWSNVPLRSNWFWCHVGYSYLLTAFVLVFLARQRSIMEALETQTKGVLGDKSVLIRSGLPSTTDALHLTRFLRNHFQEHRIREVKIVHDLHNVHSVLAHRRRQMERSRRLEGLHAKYQSGDLSWNLVLCPGPMSFPSISEIIWPYTKCLPCANALQKRRPDSFKSEKYCERLQMEMKELEKELEIFPEDVLYRYGECSGAAFIVFDSKITRNRFLRLTQSPFSCPNWIAKRSFASLENKELLSQLCVTIAPEPHDVLWPNLSHRPNIFKSFVDSFLRQIAMFLILLVFSTPTNVLVYLRVDANSQIYSKLYAQQSQILAFAATYLPSLFLILVNWLLLTILYYLSMTQVDCSESRRIQSLIVKGFVYLSSILLPYIGVPAAFVALNGLQHREESKSYLESFLFKVSGTLFITYLCQ
uniref:Uncharacterized protein AlNc14C46G3718 n=1 Tax=Albugo laibachii Nc14 TaxID=890382 RepID=F0WAJ4_9STRA|nr:conserved hypothetical protein [Albugo laibachii Nc14]|eukprot:CCA18165.1 conserved hypothetical protein [Albugo laibachii Nc14]